MSGGKGGSKTTQTTIPDWLKEPSVRNMQRAEDAQQIGYMPYYGADMAAFNPTQTSAMQQNIGAAEAFGLAQPGALTPLQGLPQAQNYGGVQGYSSSPLYEQALAELKAKQPNNVQEYDKLFNTLK
jgi:hypothetical protein